MNRFALTALFALPAVAMMANSLAQQGDAKGCPKAACSPLAIWMAESLRPQSMDKRLPQRVGPAPTANRLSPEDLARIHGRIQFVDALPDYRVQVVTALPDLKVQIVDSLPHRPGQWQIVESLPDYRIQIVGALPDFKIQYVTALPGLP
ncbi:MAG: hypothetical protein SNJ52_04640 [Verrucomicrobiia bacterium]